MWSPNGPSGSISPGSSQPSRTTSAFAGTWSGTVLQSTISIRLPAMNPAKRYSSMSPGSGAVAAYVTAGGHPKAIATGSLSPRLAATW